jgi:diadenosine tetraphosphate (Ap4A) HIT family hydrolase
MVECISCDQHAQLTELPQRDRIHLGTHWRVAHAWSALPGWLVVISLRHVVDLAQLEDEEATELGLILRQSSAALGEMTGCLKTYVMSFGEQPGFEHLHVHMVPRMADFEKRHLGSGVFEFLKRPECEWVPAEARDRLAVALAEVFDRASDGADEPARTHGRH